MANDKQETVSLDEAWREYWPNLFQGADDWNSSLQRVILRRVALLEFGEPAIGSVSPQQILPNWTDNLQITLSNQTVSMSIDGLHPLNCRLIFEGMTEENPHWRNQHPVKEIVKLGFDSKQSQKLWLGDCQKILNRATIGVGKAVRQALSAAIQDGKFVVIGRLSDAPFDEPKPLPQSAFSGSFELNFFYNTVSLGAGDAKISVVSLSPMADCKTDQPRSNSFEEADLVLVEEMKQLLDRGEALTILDATNQVLRRASRQENSTNDSVIERLRRRFGRHHPNYMRQKSN